MERDSGQRAAFLVSRRTGISRHCREGEGPYTSFQVERDLSDFEEQIGHKFLRRDLLTRGLTHKSYSHEARQDDVRDNETFEFLGDSVLGFVIGDLLFRRFPKIGR